MEKEEVKITDLHRILFGDAPSEYVWEVFFRTLVIFLMLIVFLRLIGKRMGGQFTISELAIMLSLGATIAVPMQTPERGILQGLIIMITFLFLHRKVNLWEVRNRKVEQLLQGNAVLLVRDGVIETKNMSACRISKQQLFAVLREKNVHNLGKVKRVYLEASGIFSIYELAEAKPGLSVLPPKDREIETSVLKEDPSKKSCGQCGNTVTNGAAKSSCNLCSSQNWIKSTW